VEQQYQNLMKDELANHARYAVLAGIVMTKGPTADDAELICLTTGSKCISGTYLSMEGEALNDCHAEVLARRCLVTFLYDKLMAHESNPSESIFEAGDGLITENAFEIHSRLKLKPNFLFHLYISTAPCGDARIFTLTDSVVSPLQDLHPNRQGRGALRTKIESGEGIIAFMIFFFICSITSTE